MLSTSSTYQALLANPAHKKEARLDINGVSYYADTLVSVRVSRSLFAGTTSTIGGCLSSKIEAELRLPSTAIPRMAKLEPFVRLTDGTNNSEWLPQGVFYIDTRQIDPETQLLTLTGYDVMLKIDRQYTVSQTGWPKGYSTIANEIASTIGTTVDSRTSFSSGLRAVRPTETVTMRDMLAAIATVEAGNWYITMQGKLRLVRVGEIPAETYLLTDDYGNPISFGGVRILVN